jgi:hypothetical protein
MASALSGLRRAPIDLRAGSSPMSVLVNTFAGNIGDPPLERNGPFSSCWRQ